jgi:hypothetical protein
MIKFKLERGFNIVPVRFIVIELDLLIVRIFHVAENGGQVTFRRFIALPANDFACFATSSMLKPMQMKYTGTTLRLHLTNAFSSSVVYVS